MRNTPRWVWAAAAGLALWHVALKHYGWRLPLIIDEGEYACQARLLSEGGLPYRDAHSPKPPAIFFLYRLAYAVSGHPAAPPAKERSVRAFLDKSNRFLDLPLGLGPRALLLLAVLLLAPFYVAPLWRLTMFAPQYPGGLRLDIYSYKLEGGNAGQDIREINVLNHYIGMRDLVAEDFTEFKWMPFVVGGLGLLFLRAAVLGKIAHLVDVSVMSLYFGLFSLWAFAYKLYRYGHDLSPMAAVKVDPFMPPLFGYKQLANFEVYSYPGLASYALMGAVLLLLAALVLGWRQGRAPAGVAGTSPATAA